MTYREGGGSQKRWSLNWSCILNLPVEKNVDRIYSELEHEQLAWAKSQQFVSQGDVQDSEKKNKDASRRTDLG